MAENVLEIIAIRLEAIGLRLEVIAVSSFSLFSLRLAVDIAGPAPAVEVTFREAGCMMSYGLDTSSLSVLKTACLFVCLFIYILGFLFVYISESVQFAAKGHESLEEIVQVTLCGPNILTKRIALLRSAAIPRLFLSLQAARIELVEGILKYYGTQARHVYQKSIECIKTHIKKAMYMCRIKNDFGFPGPLVRWSFAPLWSLSSGLLVLASPAPLGCWFPVLFGCEWFRVGPLTFLVLNGFFGWCLRFSWRSGPILLHCAEKVRCSIEENSLL